MQSSKTGCQWAPHLPASILPLNRDAQTPSTIKRSPISHVCGGKYSAADELGQHNLPLSLSTFIWAQGRSLLKTRLCTHNCNPNRFMESKKQQFTLGRERTENTFPPNVLTTLSLSNLSSAKEMLSLRPGCHLRPLQKPISLLLSVISLW